jgi:Na+-transporting NADH:ubiquinone oxidoreductase subunit NqrE
MNAVRNTTAIIVAAVVGAVLGLLQVAVAELADITTLGADFGGGNDRVQGAQVTLVAWYCAMAVPLAVAIAGARRGLGLKTRAVTVLAAAAGTLAAYPLAAEFSSDGMRHNVVSAVLIGILLGIVGASAVAVAPVVGKGLAAYVALLWVAALVFTSLVSNTVVYAGLVQPLGLDFLDSLGSSLPDLPYNLGYHLPTMLPVAVVILILAGALSGITARRTGAWAASIATGAAGPVLAAILYRLTPDELSLWNESAGALVFALAVCCLVISTAATAVFRRRAPRGHDSAIDPVEEPTG